jgi:hypothetical protein
MTMKKEMLVCVLTFVLMGGIGLFPTQAMAEELKWKEISYISNVQGIPVGDEEGHRLAVFERRGSVIFEDGEMAADFIVGTADITKESNIGECHQQYSFKDGSTIWTKAQFTGKIPSGEKLFFMEVKAEFVKGTGRFEGIKGSYACKGPYITPPTPDKTKGDLVLECSGTRILPRR